MTQKGSDPSLAEGEPDANEMAAYIADMTKELAVLARRSRLEIVAYLLDIVQLEASGRVRPPAGGTDRRIGA